jgi:hypothetical protein
MADAMPAAGLAFVFLRPARLAVPPAPSVFSRTYRHRPNEERRA